MAKIPLQKGTRFYYDQTTFVIRECTGAHHFLIENLQFSGRQTVTRQWLEENYADNKLIFERPPLQTKARRERTKRPEDRYPDYTIVPEGPLRMETERRHGLVLLIESWSPEQGLIKDTRVACVLVGLQGHAEEVVYQNEQLGGLFGDPWRLTPFTWDKPDTKYEENLSEFQKLLVLLEQALPFREPSHLYKLDLAWRCYVATGGVLRYVMKLVSQTSKLALKEGREHLDQALFTTAIQRSPKIIRHGVGNPFEPQELPAY